MKTINSLDQILKLAANGNLYVRWSRGPAMDKRQGCSRDYVSGSHHNGLSCQRINPDNHTDTTAMMLVEYRFLQRKDGKIYGWLLTGDENGKDSDNAPTVDGDSIVAVGRLADDLVERLAAFSESYWRYQRTSPKSFAERDAWYAGQPKLDDYLRG